MTVASKGFNWKIQLSRWLKDKIGKSYIITPFSQQKNVFWREGLPANKHLLNVKYLNHYFKWCTEFDIWQRSRKLAHCQHLSMHVVQANIFTSEVWRIRRLPLRRVVKVWRSSGCPKVGWGRTFTGGTSFQSEWLYCFHRPHRRRCNFTHPLRLLCRHYVCCVSILE